MQTILVDTNIVSHFPESLQLLSQFEDKGVISWGITTMTFHELENTPDAARRQELLALVDGRTIRNEVATLDVTRLDLMVLAAEGDEDIARSLMEEVFNRKDLHAFEDQSARERAMHRDINLIVTARQTKVDAVITDDGSSGRAGLLTARDERGFLVGVRIVAPTELETYLRSI